MAVDKEKLHRRINVRAQDPDTSFRLKSVTYMKLFGRSKPCGPTALLVRITFHQIHQAGPRPFSIAFNAYLKRVSMGLTDRRTTAKNLVDSRKN